MPEFHLDTSGHFHVMPNHPLHQHMAVNRLEWGNLDAFTQGYIEALFFTECSDPDDGELEGKAFSDLASETLATVLRDCAKFQIGEAWQALQGADDDCLDGCPGGYAGLDAYAGHDFWLTRNGHGAGFWDGDWPEPYATALTAACKAFPSVDAYRGDDGRVYLA